MASKIIDRGFIRARARRVLSSRFFRPLMPAFGFTGLDRLTAEEPLPGLTMLPSTTGPIRKILFTIPPEVLADDMDPVRLSQECAYIALFASLPVECTIVVLAMAHLHGRVTEWLDKAGVTDPERKRVLPADQTDKEMTMWAADPFWTCIDKASGGTVLVEPSSFDRKNDRAVADDVTDGLSLGRQGLMRQFQGGNILVGDDYWLVGIDTVRDLVDQGDDVSVAYSALESARSPIIIDAKNLPTQSHRWLDRTVAGHRIAHAPFMNTNSRQPIFHIDLFLTLAGKLGGDGRGTILVGDPAMATALIGGPTWPSTIPDPTMQDAFDEIAASLVSADFNVVRIPLPFLYEDDRGFGKKRREYYWASYNNALVDNTSRRVWLPTYKDAARPELEDADDKSAAIWAELGFTVTQLPDFNAFASAQGSLNCIKNVLARGD